MSAPIIEGALIFDGTLEGTLSVPSTLTGSLSPTQIAVVGDLSNVGTVDRVTPVYDGSYEITPSAGADQILATNGKRMEDDVTVLEIPYYETTNESGGYTVIIG